LVDVEIDADDIGPELDSSIWIERAEAVQLDATESRRDRVNLHVEAAHALDSLRHTLGHGFGTGQKPHAQPAGRADGEESGNPEQPGPTNDVETTASDFRSVFGKSVFGKRVFGKRVFGKRVFGRMRSR